MHTLLDFVKNVLAPLTVIVLVFTPWAIQKRYEYKHPNKFHYDPEFDTPEVLHALAKMGKL